MGSPTELNRQIFAPIRFHFIFEKAWSRGVTIFILFLFICRWPQTPQQSKFLDAIQGLLGVCVSVSELGHYAGNVTYLKFMYFLAKRLAKSKAYPSQEPKRKTANSGFKKRQTVQFIE